MEIHDASLEERSEEDDTDPELGAPAFSKFDAGSANTSWKHCKCLAEVDDFELDWFIRCRRSAER